MCSKLGSKTAAHAHVNPIHICDRDVLRKRVENVLNLLEIQEVISSVTNSDWRSPLVVKSKPDGRVIYLKIDKESNEMQTISTQRYLIACVLATRLSPLNSIEFYHRYSKIYQNQKPTLPWIIKGSMYKKITSKPAQTRQY